MLKNYQSIHIKMAPPNKSIASLELEKIKKKITITNNPNSTNNNIININRSKEFSASNSTTNNNANNNSHIAVHNSIGKQNQSNIISHNPSSSSIINNNSYLNKGNLIFLNNSKNKTENLNNQNNSTSITTNTNINNNSKNNLKTSLNFSNDYYTGVQTNLNNIPNRFVSSNKNSNFIAPAYLKNLNTKNESIDRINKVNEYKITNNNHLANQKNVKPKSICIKLIEKDIKEEMINESFNQDSHNKNDEVYSKEKYDENENQDRVKIYSKDHFKDLKNYNMNLNEIVINKLNGKETTTRFLPISGNTNQSEFNRSKNIDGTLNGNKNKFRNNINITNNSSYDDNKFSFNKNFKNSKLKELEEKHKIPSPPIRKESILQNTNNNTIKISSLPGEKILKHAEENFVMRNSQIQIKNILNNKNALRNNSNSSSIANLNINHNIIDNIKKPLIDKKISESILEKEKRILGNFNKIEKLRNLELKDLDSLDMKINTTHSSNKKNENLNFDNQKNSSEKNNEQIINNLLLNNKIIKQIPLSNDLIKHQSSSEITCYSGANESNGENIRVIPITNFNNNRNKNSDFNKEIRIVIDEKNEFIENNTLKDNGEINVNKTKSNTTEDKEIAEFNDSLEKSITNKSNKENENPNTNLLIKNKSSSNKKKSDSNKKNNKHNNDQKTKDKNNNDLNNIIKIHKEDNKENSHSYTNNPQIPYEYLNDIHLSLSYEEKQIPLFFGYMKNHTDINEQMRAILVDWIIEVHSKFNLKEETLFLCVFIIDKFLKSEVIPRSKLQLLGVSSIMIACKQEEIYSPSIRDFVFITDNAYTKQEIFDMEYQILKTLEFNTVMASSLRFYELIALDFNFDSKQFNFGLYLLELYLIDYRMTKYLPSVIACTAAYIVMKFFKMPNYTKIYSNWNKNTNSSSLIKDCAREICFLVDNINGSSLKATKKKFSQEKYDSVSLINFF